jgi:hypothetical protein
MAANLGIDPSTVCFIIVKAREFDVKEDVVQDDPASNSSDDNFVKVLEDRGDDPTEQEITSFINDMNVDEQARLVALTWVGRGDYGVTEWAEAVQMAHSRHTGSTARYLLGIPLLGDYLEEGLSQFGYSCVGDELLEPR